MHLLSPSNVLGRKGVMVIWPCFVGIWYEWRSSFRGGEGGWEVGRAGCRIDAFWKLVQKSLTRCAAAPSPAVSTMTGAQMKLSTSAAAFFTASVCWHVVDGPESWVLQPPLLSSPSHVQCVDGTCTLHILSKPRSRRGKGRYVCSHCCCHPLFCFTAA